MQTRAYVKSVSAYASIRLFCEIKAMVEGAFRARYLNYLGRVKYKDHFSETTKLWFRFDKKGLTVLSLLLHFIIITTGILFLACYDSFQFLAGLGCGFLILNVVVDERTLKRNLPCIEMKCEKLDAKKKCLNCFSRDEYDVSLFPRVRITTKKKSAINKDS